MNSLRSNTIKTSKEETPEDAFFFLKTGNLQLLKTVKTNFLQKV